MEVKPGYKQTEVGIVPEDWGVRPLAEVAKVTSGKRLPLGYLVTDKVTPYPYVRVTDMRPGRVDTRDIKYVPEAAYPPISKYRIFKDDLFISVAGTLGIVGSIPDELDGANLTENADRISAITCEKDYLLHVMLSPVVQGVIESEQTVGAQPKLALMRIRNFAIPLPPTEVEQRAIAGALSDVDALLGGLDRLIAKKRDLKQAAMQQLLTGQTRLPGFSGAWETISLTEIVTKTAGFWGLEKSDVAHQNHVGVIRAGDISPEGKLTATATRYFSDSELAKAQCKLGDVVITGSGSVGKVWWCDGRSDIAASNFVRILRPIGKRVDGRWLFQLLLSEATQRMMVEHVATGVMANLGSSFFTTEWLHLPSPSEQRGIAEVLSDMDAELAALKARRDKTRDLKQAMMQELLTGKTRLVKPEAAHA